MSPYFRTISTTNHREAADSNYKEVYKLKENELVNISKEKDLDNKLKFEDHIGGKVKKANMIAGLRQISFDHLDFKLFKTLYIPFVRPHLESASPVWSSYPKKHVNLIEKVQRRAAKG